MLFKIDKNVEFSRNYGFFFRYALFGADVSLAKFAVMVLTFLPKFQSVLETVVAHIILLLLESFVE
jgi:hypothetical protein